MSHQICTERASFTAAWEQAWKRHDTHPESMHAQQHTASRSRARSAWCTQGSHASASGGTNSEQLLLLSTHHILRAAKVWRAAGRSRRPRPSQRLHAACTHAQGDLHMVTRAQGTTAQGVRSGCACGAFSPRHMQEHSTSNRHRRRHWQ
jgi:hypothetical protein